MSGIGVEIKMTGLSSMLRRLEALPPELGATGGGPLRKALRAGGRVIKDSAVRKAPRGKATRSPGRLRRAIRVITDRNPQKANATELVAVDVRRRSTRSNIRKKLNPNSAYYWWFVENGTSKMRAQPFMRPGFETSKAEALTQIESTMEKALKAAERKLARMK